MHGPDWRSRSVAVALLILQVGMSTLGTIGMCVDRPHTHGGIPAPDCLMHQPQPAETAPATPAHTHHHQHGGSTPTDTARLACSCSADPLTLLTSEIAVVPIGLSIAAPDLITRPVPELSQPAPDVRVAPIAPPPKPSLS
jgi:hypothetical protein